MKRPSRPSLCTEGKTKIQQVLGLARGQEAIEIKLHDSWLAINPVAPFGLPSLRSAPPAKVCVHGAVDTALMSCADSIFQLAGEAHDEEELGKLERRELKLDPMTHSWGL